MTTRQLRIGTSGWSYDHWKGVFYPSDLSKREWLERYADEFDTVELNATFYRMPAEKTFHNWKRRTPEYFVWAVKASRYITHRQRLENAGQSLEKFYSRVRLLNEKLGAVLVQLPPTLEFEPGLAKEFCDCLQKDISHVIEARHESWCSESALELLREKGIGWCISHSAGRYPYLEEITTDFAYLRLHGPGKMYASGYSEEQLKEWAEKIAGWEVETFVYFNNDIEGYAVHNARRLREVMQQS
jgi:uncharacterized protein YecE (DUF72 family)